MSEIKLQLSVDDIEVNGIMNDEDISKIKIKNNLIFKI